MREREEWGQHQNIQSIDDLTALIVKLKKDVDLSKIISAYEFAEKAHGNQKRSSGEPYIIHPLSVAGILVEILTDTDTICAALLHDVVEDTPYTLDDLRRNFGRDVAMLVDGVTKMEKMPYYDKDEQSEKNAYKVLVATVEDPRVIIIKIADRLHNVRTLQYLPENKRLRIAGETLRIYSPIARNCGMGALYREMEMRAFHILDPVVYKEIEDEILLPKEEGKAFLQSVIDRLNEMMKQGVESGTYQRMPKIYGREKSIYSLYNKIYRKNKNPGEIYDMYAVRIIVDTVAECYCVYAAIQEEFPLISDRTKDYIEYPKSNDYRSLHTVIIPEKGMPCEVQIRTWEMHEHAEYGVAAHWRYKEGSTKRGSLDSYTEWIRNILDSDQEGNLVEMIRSDREPKICVMTPKAKPILLSIGSTVLDFAYQIHTELGHRTKGAMVNGKLVPIDYVLKNGQVCNVVTAKDSNYGPSRSWQDIAKMPQTRAKIRSWFRRECRDENIEFGRAALEREFKRNHIAVPEEELAEFLQDDLKRHQCKTLDDFYATIGCGSVMISKLMPRLREKYVKQYETESEPEQNQSAESADLLISQGAPVILTDKNGYVVVDQIDSVAHTMAKCCNPLPGGEIVVFTSRESEKGFVVHSVDCPNYILACKRGDPETMQRWRKAVWSAGAKADMVATIEVLSLDRTGLLSDVTKIFADSHMSIIDLRLHSLKNGNVIIRLQVQVNSSDQLRLVMQRVRRIKDVISVSGTGK